jgi:hypothetical protein
MMNAMSEIAKPKYFISFSFSLLRNKRRREPTSGVARRYVSK